MKGKNWLLNAWVCLWHSFASTIELFKTHLWSFALNWSSSTITQSVWITMESIIGILRHAPALFYFESNLKLFLFRNLGICYSQWLKAIQLRNLFFFAKYCTSQNAACWFHSNVWDISKLCSSECTLFKLIKN